MGHRSRIGTVRTFTAGKTTSAEGTTTTRRFDASERNRLERVQNAISTANRTSEER